MDNTECDEKRALKSRLNALWKREEIYWKQHSRMKWLTHGDKNTRYFHQTTFSRCQRNKIIRIKGEEGEWIEEERQIMHELQSFYVRLFTSSRTRDDVGQHIEESLNFTHTQLSRNVNDRLVRRESIDEV